MTLTFSNPQLLSNLYTSLASPTPTPVRNPSRPISSRATPLNLSPTKSNSNPISPVHLDFPPGSLLPTQMKTPLLSPVISSGVGDDQRGSGSGSVSGNGKGKGKMPALSHLLSVGEGRRVLCVEVDERYIYAGCQGRDNEIVVFSRGSLQPKYRLLGHQGSILALLIVKEKQWLVSSSSAGDVRIWSTETLQPIYIIHPCDDTSGDIYSLAWDNSAGGTLYFGSQSSSIEWVNFANPSQPGTSSSGDNPRTRKPSIPTSSASLTVPVQPLPNRSSAPLSPSTSNQPQTRTGRYRPHRFFDQIPSPSGISTPKYSTTTRTTRSNSTTTTTTTSPIDTFPSSSLSNPTDPAHPTVIEIEIEASSRLAFAHFGYIYALHLLPRSPISNFSSNRNSSSDQNTDPSPNPTPSWLISGSGDSDIHIYTTLPSGGIDPTPIHVFEGLPGAVLSLCVRGDDVSLLYAGLQGGVVLIFDLETGSVIRSLEVGGGGGRGGGDVLGLSCACVNWDLAGESEGSSSGTGGESGSVGAGGGSGVIWFVDAEGWVGRIEKDFEMGERGGWKGHEGAGLGVGVVKSREGGRWELITGGNDGFVKIWSIDNPETTVPVQPPDHHINGDARVDVEGEGDVMLYALSKLVAMKTVSDDEHRETCRQGAHLLKKILTQLGAQSEVLSGEQGKNPLVLATFTGKDIGRPRKRVLFYGHYDVQPAEESRWRTNPWELTGRNGYLYGRGVSDNKGPILAVACAAASLRQRRELDVDLVMLIEGEEEAGSRGFATTVRKHKESIGMIDTILLSNSTWIDETDPCIVFGMRGVVYANLAISSPGPDKHSGVDGGIVGEPMGDMIRVLGELGSGENVKIPGFYDQVRPQTESEVSLLRDVAQASGRKVEDLIKVWRQPSFSIANIQGSSEGNKTVIPNLVKADISMRIVPDQDLKVIVEGLKVYCKKVFDGLGSTNTFEMTVTHTASWWLSSLTSPYFRALEQSVSDIWGTPPLKIREGGTVPTIFWLEQEFGAGCVHLPLGQGSDAGHLANERMRLLNLRNGKRVIESYLTRIAKIEDGEE